MLYSIVYQLLYYDILGGHRAAAARAGATIGCTGDLDKGLEISIYIYVYVCMCMYIYIYI